MNSRSIIWACIAIAVVLLCGCVSQSGNNGTISADNSRSSTQYDPISIVSVTTVPSSGNAAYITYENPAYRLKLSYPSNLRKQEEISGDIMFFLSPQDSTIDAYPANLDIMVLNLSAQPMSLDTFTDQSLAEIQGIVPDYNLTDSRKASLGKEDAHLIAYTGTQGLLKLKWMSVYAIKNDILYLVTYTAGADRFQLYLPAVSKMLDSFEIY